MPQGAQQHGQRYIPMLLERMGRDEIVTEYLATPTLPLSEGQRIGRPPVTAIRAPEI